MIDNGIGFEQSSAEQIFEPSKRLVTAQEFEGTGIGMATAKGIVDLHEGTISALGKRARERGSDVHDDAASSD